LNFIPTFEEKKPATFTRDLTYGTPQMGLASVPDQILVGENKFCGSVADTHMLQCGFESNFLPQGVSGSREPN
jgi:hypothetical protein